MGADVDDKRGGRKFITVLVQWSLRCVKLGWVPICIVAQVAVGACGRTCFWRTRLVGDRDFGNKRARGRGIANYQTSPCAPLVSLSSPSLPMRTNGPSLPFQVQCSLRVPRGIRFRTPDLSPEPPAALTPIPSIRKYLDSFHKVQINLTHHY